MDSPQKTYVFDINTIDVIDLDGFKYQMDLTKPIGNACFMYFSSIEWDDLARAIHRGEAVTLTEQELSELQGLIRSPHLKVLTAVRSAINAYINKLKIDLEWELNHKEDATTADIIDN